MSTRIIVIATLALDCDGDSGGIGNVRIAVANFNLYMQTAIRTLQSFATCTPQAFAGRVHFVYT
jgi:hypothetical protein